MIVLMAALVWIAKLSFDVMRFRAHSKLLSSMKCIANQTTQRQFERSSWWLCSVTKITLKQNPATVTYRRVANLPNWWLKSIHPILLIKQQLDLVEFALKQQQFVVATDKLASFRYAARTNMTLAAGFEAKFASSYSSKMQRQIQTICGCSAMSSKR